MQGTAVHNCIMPDRNIVANIGGVFLVGTMNNCAILHIYPVTHFYIMHITPYHSIKPETAFITGGTGILGGEIACALIGVGANVAILDRNTEVSEAYKERLAAGPGQYMVVHGDVLRRDVLETAVAQIVAEYGRIDILINAAGGNHPQATTTPDNSFFDLPQEALGFVFNLNLILALTITLKLFMSLGVSGK